MPAAPYLQVQQLRHGDAGGPVQGRSGGQAAVGVLVHVPDRNPRDAADSVDRKSRRTACLERPGEALGDRAERCARGHRPDADADSPPQQLRRRGEA
jgi:hypothetical protein